MTTHSANECKCIGFMSGAVMDTQLCDLHRHKEATSPTPLTVGEEVIITYG